MAISVVMPALEMAQETGKIISWLKKEGDTITKGEPLLEVETDKAVVEIEATADGVLAGVKSAGRRRGAGRHDDRVDSGAGRNRPVETAAAAQTGRTMTSIRSVGAAAPVAALLRLRTGCKIRHGGGPQISPKARRLAKEHGVDITRVHGTGPDGTITSDDVMAAAAAGSARRAPAAAAPEPLEPVSHG